MTHEYELADDNRTDLIYEKSELLGPLLPGMVAPPHAMVEGRRRRITTRARSPGPQPSRSRQPAGEGAT